MTWELHDNTNGRNHGYLQLTLDGERVCDFFPYANCLGADLVRERAALILETLVAAAQQTPKETV